MSFDVWFMCKDNWHISLSINSSAKNTLASLSSKMFFVLPALDGQMK